jgi:hypothetical protein
MGNPLMDWTTLPIVWAQVQAQGPGQPAGVTASSMYFMALRRWCSSLTLSSPRMVPSLAGLWTLLFALGALLVLVLVVQGPSRALRQIFNVMEHGRLIQKGSRRVWRAGRLVSAAIGFTVLSWTASQAVTFERAIGKNDLLNLTRTRGLAEIALEHGAFAGLTPLRDVGGLGDNLPLLVIAVMVVFKAAMEPPPVERTSAGHALLGSGPRRRAGWTTLVWGSASLYALYRVVSRLAGGGDLPMGGGPVAVAAFIPFLMLISDAALLAWVLTELRRSGLDETGEDRLEVWQAMALLPGVLLACAVALPARYIATFLWLGSAYLPTTVNATWVGDYLRWQLGPGLTYLQGAALPAIGLLGVVAWSRGTIKEAVAGYARMLAAEGGHLVVALAMAGAAACVLAAPAYAVLLLLPAQTWVLSAADAYSHFATLPVGLWTLAALVELAERSLPAATIARPAPRQSEAEVYRDAERPSHHDALPPVGAPVS